MTAVKEAPARRGNVDLRSIRASAAALKTFFRLADTWELTADEQATLLRTNRSTVYKWQTAAPVSLSADVLERLSYLFGIYAALNILLPLPERAHA